MRALTEILPIPFVDLVAQQRSIQGELDAAIRRVTEEAAYILGPEVSALETAFAEYCESEFAVGVDSGTSALELALRALGVGPGDEVITVANSFVAGALAISFVGATPVLVDAEPDTYQMDPNAVERAITPRTRAVLPVHLYGHPAELDAIAAIARWHGLALIEDACQAHGARYHGRRVGGLGDVAAFSFYPGKNLGAWGDGGMVVTNDPDVAQRIRQLRNYGQTEKYYHSSVGFNRRLDTLQASILLAKLPHLDDWNCARRKHAARYTELFAPRGIETPRTAPGVESVWHLYPIQVERRDELRSFLAEQGISTGIHYPVPIHLQECYADLGYAEGAFPVAERQARRMVSLPMFPELTQEQIEYVAESVIKFELR